MCRDILVREEIGVKDKENGLVLNMDMSNLDEITDLMYNSNLKSFDYTLKESDKIWQNILGKKTKTNYKEELKMRYEVEALKVYEEKNIVDIILKRIPKEGEIFIVDKERLDVLLGDNTHKTAFIKVLKEIKEDEEKLPIKILGTVVQFRRNVKK